MHLTMLTSDKDVGQVVGWMTQLAMDLDSETFLSKPELAKGQTGIGSENQVEELVD